MCTRYVVFGATLYVKFCTSFTSKFITYGYNVINIPPVPFDDIRNIHNTDILETIKLTSTEFVERSPYGLYDYCISSAVHYTERCTDSTYTGVRYVHHVC